MPAQAAARSALTADERKLGAIVIDIGGAVTSLALIRDDKILAAESISLGGMHLTNDVAQGLSTSIAHAERMKTLWGTLIEGGHNEREMLAVPLLGERGTDAMQRVPRSHLTTILRARVEEILEHCVARLATPAFAAGAGCRVILTGGTSQLPGLAELAAKLLQHSVRIGSLAAVNGLLPQHQHPGMAACVGTILLAAQPQPQYALPQETQAAFARANQGYARRLSHWLAAAF